MAVVEFRKVDIIFGRKPETAIAFLDRGANRDEILAETGQVLGVDGGWDLTDGQYPVVPD